MAKVLIACGGTGGHLAPGIALAQRLVKMGHFPVLVTSTKTIDNRMASKYGTLQFLSLPGSVFSLRPGKFLRFFTNFFRSFFRCFRLLKDREFGAVVAFGGFMSAGICCAAFLRRRPIFLHESNQHIGRAIRYLSPLARRIFVPPALKKMPPLSKRPRYLAMGYPLREDFIPVDKAEARRQMGFPDYGNLLVVTGGSQGAQVFVEWMRTNEKTLAEHRFHCLCLSGLGGLEGKFVHGIGGDESYLTVYKPFCDEMHLPYSAADVAVCRAGAGTIAEIIGCGTPSILIPYPHAAGDHQTANGNVLADLPAAVMLHQKNMGELLHKILCLRHSSLAATLKINLETLRNEAEDSATALANFLNRELGGGK